ncbi:MAG: hypothetical protein RBS37_06285 [Bacteroidales bacterium]|jgi:V/A-type H+-transporting ATPase subunit E|nr:hypothetical protein [Bacteroidales bacterium]
MQNKLQELTDKIYREGVSKANDEAEKILADSRNESARILAEAEKKAASIIEEAEKKAAEIVKNGNSELKISFRHALNALKQELEKTVSAKILSGKVSGTFDDENFVADLIQTIYKNWSPQGGGAAGFEVLLPADKASAVEKKLRAAVSSTLAKGIEFKPVSSVKSGFEVIPAGGGFKISATGGDIEAYLKEFIRPKLFEILFEES